MLLKTRAATYSGRPHGHVFVLIQSAYRILTVGYTINSVGRVVPVEIEATPVAESLGCEVSQSRTANSTSLSCIGWKSRESPESLRLDILEDERHLEDKDEGIDKA